MGVKPSIIVDPGAALKQARQLLSSDPAAATRQARQLLQANPGDPAALRLLGAGLRRLGKAKEAEQAEQEAIEASTRSPAHRQAVRAIAGGDHHRARAILEALIARDGNDVVAMVLLGLQCSRDGDMDLAEALLRKASQAAPGDKSARLALARHLHQARRAGEALDELDRLPAAAAHDVAALSLRAKVLRDLGRQEEEVEILRKLASSQPRSESYWLQMGHALRNLGRTDQAVAAYRQVLATSPHEGTAWWSLANLKTVRFSDDDIAAMEQALGFPDAPDLNRIRLQFALGKAHEDRGEPEHAFFHYSEGNRLRDATSAYQPGRIQHWVDEAQVLYTEAFFADRTASGSPSGEPIFLVGMQRSGSTLVEQILDSHPQVEGASELPLLPAMLNEQRAIAQRRGMGLSEHLRRLGPGELRALGEDYVRRARAFRQTDKPFFTDKMPANWMYVGVIRLILPNARIIDVRRHPLACCFANWKQLYATGLEHSYSMENMGRYYADYVRLMRLIDRVQPGKVHRVRYERLVEDVEGEVRGLLDFLELPFDLACLDFHSNERSVRTISAEQVRRPINRDGLDRWRPYEQWLGPMKTALGSALEDWDA